MGSDGCGKAWQREEPLSKPPVTSRKPDGGWGWVVTLASFMMNFLPEAVGLTFGLFVQDILEQFNESTSKTLSLNSVLEGTLFLIGPLAGVLTNKYGCRKVAMLGSFLSGMGLFFSTFSPNLDIMILLYAVVGGFGFGLMMLPAQAILTHYFENRLSLSNGIARGGSGVGGFVLAPLSVYLLDTYGWRGTIWIMSGLCLNGMVFASLYRPIEINKETRNNISTCENGVDLKSPCMSNKSIFDISLFTRPAMWIYGLVCFLFTFGVFIPYNFLPVFVDDLGISASQAALLISIISICNTVMRVLIGLLGDQSWADSIIIHSILLIICGTVTCFVPLYREFGVLATYSVIFGSGAGSYVALKPSILLEVLPSYKLSDIYGVVNACQGIGVFLGSPIAGLLVDKTGNYNIAFYISGASICLAGLLGFLLRILTKWKKHRAETLDTRIAVFHLSGS